MSAVELRRGILHVSGTVLSLDATRKSDCSFVSHGHSDHIARHDRAIGTQATLRFMKHRLGAVNSPLPAPYNRPFELGTMNLELLPAGHILGSAQLRIIRDDGLRVVYTGDLNPVPSLTAEPLQVAECDTLVIESTFGHPRYCFPPKEEVLGAVEAWVRAQLERDVTPVLLGYPLGKSQEAMKFLSGRGFTLCAHSSVFEVTELYAELGCSIPNVRCYDGTWNRGDVGFFPPHVWRKGIATAAMGARCTAVLTGWAVEPGAARRYGADVAFPLSDHADFAGLVQYVKDTGAREAITHHGFKAELAQALCAQGIDARPLGAKAQQLSLF